MNKPVGRKEVTLNFRFIAGEAKPNLKSIASALSPLKVKLMDFCAQMNNDSAILEEKGKLVQVKVNVFQDGSFKYDFKGRPSTHLILESAGITKGSANPGRDTCGSISKDQLRQIVDIKSPFLTALDKDRQLKILIGTAKSLGLSIN